MTPTPSEPNGNPRSDPARGRFVVLMAVRLSSALLVVFGLGIARNRFPSIDPGIAQYLGYAMIGIGFIELVVVIPMLHRRWRSGIRAGDGEA